MMDLAKFYKENDDFKEYVDKSSKASGKSKEEIFELKTAQFIAQYYRYKTQSSVKEEEQRIKIDLDCDCKSC